MRALIIENPISTRGYSSGGGADATIHRPTGHSLIVTAMMLIKRSGKAALQSIFRVAVKR
jgi:hypothetical protein